MLTVLLFPLAAVVMMPPPGTLAFEPHPAKPAPAQLNPRVVFT